MTLLSALREWWRWRMRRARVHIPGTVEYRNTGVIMDRDDSTWRIEGDEGRIYFAEIAWTRVPDLRIGDRVEFGPLFFSAAGPGPNRGMVIHRKLNPPT
jgi:hypothetical protein